MDGTATVDQRADAGALLRNQGFPRGLQAQVQPTSIDEAEQEAEVPHRQAEARTAHLTRQRRRITEFTPSEANLGQAVLPFSNSEVGVSLRTGKSLPPSRAYYRTFFYDTYV